MSTNDPDIFNKYDEDEAGDVGDEGYTAPDEPMASHAYGTTLEEERAGETFAERDKHTIDEFDEDDLAEVTDSIGHLSAPGDEDVDAIDSEAAMVASDEGAEDDDLSAEEAAMHATDL